MTETLVQRRRRLVRDDIARIAIELFVERGFDAVTVDDIAAAAGTSQRTFFRYFASKDDIALDLVRRLNDRLLVALDARPAIEGPVTALRNAYLVTSSVAPADRDRVLQLASILTHAPALRAQARGEQLSNDDDVLTRVARRAGLRPSDRRVRVLVTAMSAVAGAEFQRWAEIGGRGNPADSLDGALELLMQGFASIDRLRPRWVS